MIKLLAQTVSFLTVSFLLSENKPTRQELLLLSGMPLPFGEWSVLYPTYIIPKTWRNSCFSLHGMKECSMLLLVDVVSLSGRLQIYRSKSFDDCD